MWGRQTHPPTVTCFICKVTWETRVSVESVLQRWRSPFAPVNVTACRFRIVVNEVTPPNFCRAHSTSSSSRLGKPSWWMFFNSPNTLIVESLFICEVGDEWYQLLQCTVFFRKKSIFRIKILSVVTRCSNHRELSESALYLYLPPVCSHFVTSNMFAHPSHSPLLLHPTLPLFSEQSSVKKKCLLWLSVHEPSCTTPLEPWSFLCFLSGARKWDLF